MSRQVELKKVENRNRRLVIFSKRKSCLIRKVRKLSVSCNTDVAVIAFSPAARLNVFCNQNRLEDFLWRYINLPADKRMGHIFQIKEKVRKLEQLDRIVSNLDNQSLFLDNQINHLENKIMKSEFELQLKEARLRDYEPYPNPTQNELRWAEAKLKRSLDLVKEKEKLLLFGGMSAIPRTLSFQMEVEQSVRRSPFDQYGNRGLNDMLQGPPHNRTWNPHYVQRQNRVVDPNSFPGSVNIEASSNHIVNMSIPGFSVSPFQVGGTSTGYAGPANNVAFENSTSAPPIQGHGTVRVQQIFTRELSYYSANHGNAASYQDPNSILPLHYEETSVTLIESLNISQNLPPSAIGPMINNFSSSINLASGSANAVTGTELSTHLIHQVEAIPEEGPLHSDLPDLLSTEAMLVDGGSPSINGASNAEIGSWDLDGYALAEDLNLEDIDIFF